MNFIHCYGLKSDINQGQKSDNMKWSFILYVNILYISIIIYYILNTKRIEKSYDDFEDPLNISSKIKPFKTSNLPPQRRNNKFESLYIAVYDDEYEPKDYQCLMKKQWIDPFLQKNLVDGIELYSLTKYTNKECNLSTVALENPPKRMKDPSSWQIHEILRSYLERSKSGWIFLVGQSAYIKTNEFFSFFENLLNSFTYEGLIMSKGSCFEPSNYFQIHQISSGVFISRKAVEKILNLDDFWEIAFSIEVDGNEALFHALDQIGVVPVQSNVNGMIGNVFDNEDELNKLLTKDFANLEKCYSNRDRNDDYFSFLDQECIRKQQYLSEIFSWASITKTNRTFFLENAEKMLSNNPENIGVKYIDKKLKLCKIIL